MRSVEKLSGFGLQNTGWCCSPSTGIWVTHSRSVCFTMLSPETLLWHPARFVHLRSTDVWLYLPLQFLSLCFPFFLWIFLILSGSAPKASLMCFSCSLLALIGLPGGCLSIFKFSSSWQHTLGPQWSFVIMIHRKQRWKLEAHRMLSRGTTQVSREMMV